MTAPTQATSFKVQRHMFRSVKASGTVRSSNNGESLHSDTQ
jgi:hypothetical protein